MRRCSFRHRQQQAAEISIFSSTSVKGAGSWHMPDLNAAVSRKKESGWSPWEAVARMDSVITLVPLPAHLGSSSAYHPCWLTCVHSLPHRGMYLPKVR